MESPAAGNLDKWKAEFARKQEENLLKAKLIQQETMNRRKTMEMKAKLEAAKEEKRRQEALAERKASHIEATMRFQKGLKHFKANREFISLEQVLRDIQPKTRKTSVDNQSARSERSSLKKTNSFNELNSSMSSNNTFMSNSERSSNLKFIAPKKVFTNASTNGTKPIVVQKTNHQQYNPYNPSYLAEELSSHLEKDVADVDYNNMYINEYKEILQENQKNLQDKNKEALKEFESLVSNQLNIENNHNNNYLVLNDRNANYSNNQKANNYTETEKSKNLMKKVLENNYIAYEKDDKLYTTDFKSQNSNQNFTNSVKNGDCNESMDADSLLNESLSSEAKIEPQLKAQQHAQSTQYYTNYELKQVDSKVIFKRDDNQSFQAQAIDHFSKPSSHQRQEPRQQDCADNESIIAIFNDTRHKEVKGILKRTTSLDSQTLAEHAAFTPAVNFGIERATVKDSLVLANQRIKAEKCSEAAMEAKKAVRFAANLTSENNSRSQSAPQSVTSVSTLHNVHVNSIQALIDKEYGKERERQEEKQKSVSAVSSHNADSESKENNVTVIRRPVIKQNSFSSKLKPMTTTATGTTANLSSMPVQKLVNGASCKNGEAEAQSNNSSALSVADKPPIHPNSPHMPMSPIYPSSVASPTTVNNKDAINNNSYALLSQRRKDQAMQQKKPPVQQKQVTSTARLNSPKTSDNHHQQQHQQQLKIEVSNNIALQQHLNANYSTSTPKPTSISSGFINPINRQPVQSPIDNRQSPSPFFPMPVFNQSENSTPVLTNYNNYRMLDNNYRDFQQPNKPPTPPVTLPQHTIFAKNQPLAKLQISNYPEASISDEKTPAQMNQNVNITKIPLSPKSTLNKTNPYLVSDNNKNSEPNRPASMPNTMTNFTSNLVISQQLRNQQAQAMTTPIATPITAIIHHQANSAPIPKNNIRFNYVNNNSPNVNNNNNHNNLLAANSPLPSPHANIPKRIFSAEPGNKNNNAPSHLTSFPLFSNYNQPNQNNNINNTKRIEMNNNTATESLAAFLTAEEMSTTNGCTESQILNTVDAINSKTYFNKNMPTSLSVEEQNVKNSILRLNDRLNVLKEKKNHPFNHVDIDAQNNYNETINVYNNASKQITVTTKSRR